VQLSGIGNQVLLVQDSAFETRNRAGGVFEIFLRGAGKQEIDPGHDRNRCKGSGKSDFQALIQRIRVAGHSLGDGKGVKCRMRDFLSLDGNAHLFQQLFVCSQGVQLHSNARQKLGRIPRTRDGVVRSEVESRGTIAGPGADKDDDANAGCKRRAANRGQNLASVHRSRA